MNGLSFFEKNKFYFLREFDLLFGLHIDAGLDHQSAADF